MPVTVKYQAAGATDPGLQRENNEDRFHYDAERGIFLVVDGMGGHAAGEMAAEIAVSMLRARLERQTGSPGERVREAIAIANNEIHRLSQSNPAWQGMACVLTVAVLEEGRLTVGHVGDSRLYLLWSVGIRKLTRDHSPVGEREERRELSEREAMQHPRRNEVYRDVGSDEHSPDDPDFIDTIEIEFPPDYALLLCSDGLTDLLTASEISRICQLNAGNPWSAARSLIEAANRAGGKDNVTVIVVEGPEYAASVRASSKTVSNPDSGNSRRPNALAGRWAFLVYGVVLGALSLFGLRGWLPEAPWLPGALKPAPSAISLQRTWFVGPAESADSGTITEALNRANPGDTIIVAPGEYPELVQLRDGVSLVSQQLHGAVVRANAQGAAVIGEGVKSGRLAGFRIVGDDARPLTVGLDLKDSDIEVQDVEISGARGAGIEIRGASNCRLRANQIVQNPGGGVVIRDTATPHLALNLISGNGKNGGIPKPGIDIRDAARPVLFGNTIVNNAAEPVWVNPKSDVAAITNHNFFGPLRSGAARRAVRMIQR
jgi:parallel beta-helix repeat protein